MFGKSYIIIAQQQNCEQRPVLFHADLKLWCILEKDQQ